MIKRPNKFLGQNFLKCRWVVETMIKSADLKLSDTVLEIGPGTGVLTTELLKKVKKVIAVEKDKSLIPDLRNLAAKNPNLEIIQGDALKILSEISLFHKLQAATYKLIANIPYYLTSRLFRILLEKGPRPSLLVLTIQKEVAERICAKEKMSLLALSVQAFGQPEIIKAVPRKCFWPEPKVDSAIIRISDISNEFLLKNKITPESFFQLIRQGFSHKRKKLVNNLGNGDKNKKDLVNFLKKAGLNPDCRAEELPLKQWMQIADFFGQSVHK